MPKVWIGPRPLVRERRRSTSRSPRRRAAGTGQDPSDADHDVAAMVQLGATVKKGTPPKSHQERLLQLGIDTIAEQM